MHESIPVVERFHGSQDAVTGEGCADCRRRRRSVDATGDVRAGPPRPSNPGRCGGWCGTAGLPAGLVLLGIAVAAAPAAAAAPPAAAIPDDRTVAAGIWRVVAAERDGTPVDQELLARLQVVYREDGSWAVFLRRVPVAAGKSTNRQDVLPKTFDMETQGTEGIAPVRYKGIYRLDGDACILCIVPEAAARPDDFSAPRHSGRMLVRLERADPAAGGR